MIRQHNIHLGQMGHLPIAEVSCPFPDMIHLHLIIYFAAKLSTRGGLGRFTDPGDGWVNEYAMC